MFILLDTTTEKFMEVYDYLNDFDDKQLYDLENSVVADVQDYAASGGYHVLALNNAPHKLTRWEQLLLASVGARVWSDKLDENSPIYAGSVPSSDKLRKIAVDAQVADTRFAYFKEFGVNYIGRTKLNPRNIFVLDNKKANPFHDPSSNEALEALYASLPDDWWGSCGFVSSGNVDKLGAFLEEFQGDTIPLAFTEGAFSKLRYLNLEYVDTGTPQNNLAYGLSVRDKANRLSYALSQPENPEPIVEDGFKYNI